MKTFSAVAVPLLLFAAGGVKAQEKCNIPADVLDSLNFTSLYDSCGTCYNSWSSYHTTTDLDASHGWFCVCRESG